jgi:hypothetical protein
MTTPSNNLQQAPYLKTQWQFPYDDLRGLSHQVDISYVDIASKVNSRTIGTYAINFPIITGEKWYFGGSSNSPQQSLRQVYQFTGAGNIPHGINLTAVSLINHKCYGSYTDGTNWYGVIYSSSVGIAGQVTFYVTPTNIVVTVDGAAPAVTSGEITLEWVSQF